MATKNLTLKRILRNHKKYPQDAKIHAIIENGDVDKEAFEGLLKKATEQEPFDKKNG